MLLHGGVLRGVSCDRSWFRCDAGCIADLCAICGSRQKPVFELNSRTVPAQFEPPELSVTIPSYKVILRSTFESHVYTNYHSERPRHTLIAVQNECALLAFRCVTQSIRVPGAPTKLCHCLNSICGRKGDCVRGRGCVQCPDR